MSQDSPPVSTDPKAKEESFEKFPFSFFSQLVKNPPYSQRDSYYFWIYQIECYR